MEKGRGGGEVMARRGGGEGCGRENEENESDTRHTSPTAPTHVPQNITEVILGPRSFLLTWEAPPLEHHNGEIRHYRINVTEVETGTRLSYTTEDTQLTITDLHPYYRYVCIVTAVTVSEGPYSANITARTHEDGKHD